MKHILRSMLSSCMATVWWTALSGVCIRLCETHRLLQVAAYADHQLCVRKTTDLDGRVHTHIANLESHHDRAQEVAAMLGMSTCVLSSCHADMPIFMTFCAFNAFSALNAFSVIACKQHVNVCRWHVVKLPGLCTVLHGTMCHAYVI
jgi:hypothetical protein